MIGVTPPPEIPMEVVHAAIHSSRRGAGPGPDGIRGDFLRDLLGHGREEEVICIVCREFVQLLANNEAPTYLQPFFGGDRLVGVGRKDASGIPISLEADARPMILGLTWRKIVFKATFSLDKPEIQRRMGDQQLALTRNGADILVHAAPAWVTAICAVPNADILQKDIRNTFNEVQPRQFLADYCNHAPTSARFAHFCYGTSTHLIYEGGIEAYHRGQ